MMKYEPFLILQEANIGELILLNVVRVTPDGGEDDDPSLLALELLCGSHHHIGRVSQFISDLLTLPPVGGDHPDLLFLHVELGVLQQLLDVLHDDHHFLRVVEARRHVISRILT